MLGQAVVDQGAFAPCSGLSSEEATIHAEAVFGGDVVVAAVAEAGEVVTDRFNALIYFSSIREKTGEFELYPAKEVF